MELAERGGREHPEAHEESLPESPVQTAKAEFRRSLQKMFSDATRVDKIMSFITHWENGR